MSNIITRSFNVDKGQGGLNNYLQKSGGKTEIESNLKKSIKHFEKNSRIVLSIHALHFHKKI